MTNEARPYPLIPAHAVAAIMVTPDRRFLMQRRDDLPHIWYPDAWALFGGGIEPGETEREALARELEEEIGFTLVEATYFTRFDFDLGFAGCGIIERSVFVVPIEPETVAGLQLREGRAMALIEADQVLGLPPQITGYDQFALYLYLNRDRITPGSAAPRHEG